MNKTIRIGTNGNTLSVMQAKLVESLIKPSGYQTEIISSEVTTDDKTKAKKNLEVKLLEGSIDVVVHHAKDLPADLHDELELVAFTQRQPPNDVLVSHNKNINLKSESKKVGTSSIRRMAFIKHFYLLFSSQFTRALITTQLEYARLLFRQFQPGHCCKSPE